MSKIYILEQSLCVWSVSPAPCMQSIALLDPAHALFPFHSDRAQTKDVAAPGNIPSTSARAERFGTWTCAGLALCASLAAILGCLAGDCI
jgi:hypothetical protein